MASREHVGQQFRNVMSPYDEYGSWYTIPHPEPAQPEPYKISGPNFVDPYGGGNGAYG